MGLTRLLSTLAGNEQRKGIEWFLHDVCEIDTESKFEYYQCFVADVKLTQNQNSRAHSLSNLKSTQNQSISRFLASTIMVVLMFFYLKLTLNQI